jgi:Family of unknown function (DUF6090)
MAEQEIIKHTKKVRKIWNSAEHTFWYKAKEFLVEILIIVFAVTLSIWLHSWSEHKHEQKQVITFLKGLQNDLKEDVIEAKELIQAYKRYDTIYTYLYKLDRNKKPDLDSLNIALGEIRNNSYLRPNNTRFNSFLSAGKIVNIENDSLAYNILEFYQEVQSRVKSSESGWTNTNNTLQNYMMDNVEDIDDIMTQFKVISSPKGKYLCKYLIPWPQLYERYEDFILRAESIILEINRY